MAHTTTEDVYLQSVIVRKPIELSDAIKWSQYYIRNKRRTYYVEKIRYYVFRNIPKMHFPVLYRKDINETVSLIYGPMRPVTTVKPIADKLEVIQEGSTKLEEELEEE
jgi:hypothetical protein